MQMQQVQVKNIVVLLLLLVHSALAQSSKPILHRIIVPENDVVIHTRSIRRPQVNHVTISPAALTCMRICLDGKIISARFMCGCKYFGDLIKAGILSTPANYRASSSVMVRFLAGSGGGGVGRVSAERGRQNAGVRTYSPMSGGLTTQANQRAQIPQNQWVSNEAYSYEDYSDSLSDEGPREAKEKALLARYGEALLESELRRARLKRTSINIAR